MIRAVQRLARSNDGNVAIIFGLTVIPFLVMAGYGLDMGRAIVVRERLSHALDAAILAVGAAPYLNDEEAQELGEQFFAANFGDTIMGSAYDITVTIEEEEVFMSARADVPTTLLALINQDFIEVYQEAGAVRGGIDLELVMVLDNTGSMSGSKITTLRNAAEDAVEILFNSGGSDPEAVKVALVPFAATVNVGSAFERAWWLDAEAASPLHAPAHNFSEPVNRWDLFDELEVDWGGCVETRAAPHDIEDTTPTLGDPETLFVPYFQPDVPGDKGDARSGYSNDHSWLSDGDWEDLYDADNAYDTENEARQANVEKYYAGQTPKWDGPNQQCIDQAIVPLTTDEETLIEEIQDMEANGYTNIPNAAAWGIRVLSPTMPFDQGRSYEDEELLKAMIILTDGDNVLDGQNNHNYSVYSSFGYVAEGRLGSNTYSDSTLTDRLDDKLEDTCEYARGLGIRVYTITFKVSGSDTRTLMEECASKGDSGDPLYWDSPSTSELNNAFRAIARDLVDLRLSK